MNVTRHELCSAIQMVWTSVVGTELTPSDTATSPATEANPLTSSIDISGEWTGKLLVECTRDLATAAAAAFFDGAEGLEEADLEEALMELVNIIAGNIKSLLPAPSAIALPEVNSGDPAPAPAPNDTTLELRFSANHERLLVRLVQSPSSEQS